MSNLHPKQVWLTASNVTQAPTSVQFLQPQTPEVPATEHQEGHGQMPTAEPQNTYGRVGQGSQLKSGLKNPVEGVHRVQCSMTRVKNHIVPLESEV